MWEVIIGLEVHAQITSESKLFSGASTSFGEEPNENVAFLDAGMPGMLPVVNSYCVDQAIKTGLGINARINEISVFDRKNYFYPDLPLGYQISQLYYPIVSGGHICIKLEDGKDKIINIERIHIEQDAGKSIHDLSPNKSYIDFNRAGVGLMEIVSQPDMRSAYEAMEYVKKLRSILRYLGTSDGNMEKGSLRADVNVSIRRPGDPLGIRTETKNVNSIKFIGQAIEYEVERQTEILESGGAIEQETLLFDPNECVSRSMRKKENAHDYRYFPDPDQKPLVVSKERIEFIKSQMPELPDAKKVRFMHEYNISEYDSDILVSERETADYFESIVKSSKVIDKNKIAKSIANWLIGEVFGAMNRGSIKNLYELPFKAHYLAELVDLINDDVISGKIAKQVFTKMWETGKLPSIIIEELGLKQIDDPKKIEEAAQEIIDKNPSQVEAYKSGKDKLFGFFVGQTMKLLDGKASPKLLNEILRQKLDKT